MKCPLCGNTGTYASDIDSRDDKPCPCCAYADALAREAAWLMVELGNLPALSMDRIALAVKSARARLAAKEANP